MSNLAQLLQAPGMSIEADGDFDAVNALVMEKGWGDGLPVVPPTEARVAAMLEYCDRPWDQPIAKIAPRWGEATPLRLAANAVMAGCQPRYFPLYMLAIEAMCEEPLNLYGVQATTHLCAPLVIVNGPVARELNLNGGHNAFGPGNQANATIGRAIRLALLNIGGATPGSVDMATVGTPAKFTFCVAENEAESPWDPLHVDLGFDRETTTVTVVGAENPHNINDHESVYAESLLKTVAGTISTVGSNNPMHASTPIVAFCPEHAATVASGGFSKADVRQYLYEHAVRRMGEFSPENIERRLKFKFPERYGNGNDDTPVTMVQTPDDLIIVVLGGAGKHSAYLPTFGTTRVVTRPLKTVDGTIARDINDFRR